MNYIGTWQSFVVYATFIMGSIATIGGTTEAGRDSAFAFLIGGLLALPLYKFYFSILYGQADLEGAKKTIVHILMMVSAVTAIFTASISQNLCTFFLSETALLITPNLLIACFISFTVLLMCRKGVTVLARMCELIFWPVVLLIIFSNIAAIPQSDLTNIMPYFEHGFSAVLNGSFTSLLFPFAEGVFGIFIICVSATEKSAKKGIYWATVVLTLLLALTFLKNIAVLGFPLIASLYFPTYTVTSVITLGAFFQRLEVFISIAFLFCQMIKISFIIIFAHKIINKVFPKLDLPISLVVLFVFNFSVILFPGVTQVFLWLSVYRYFIIPATFFVPLLLKLVVGKKKKTAP